MTARHVREHVRAVALVTTAVAVLASSGCGRSGASSDEALGSAAPSAVSSPRDLLPQDIKDAGVIRFATAEGYRPMEMYQKGSQGKKLIGVDPELAEMLAKELGLKFKIVNTQFPGLIPGLQSNQWDAAISSMSDTAERRKAVNFVDYFMAGGSIMVNKGNPEGIKDMSDLCGKKVVGASGSSNLAILQQYNKKCNTPMQISVSEDATTGLLQLDTNRSVATVLDYPVAANMVQRTGKYEVLPKQYNAGPWGIAVAKDNTGLAKALQAALTRVMDDGQYEKLLAKYGVGKSAVDKATINEKS